MFFGTGCGAAIGHPLRRTLVRSVHYSAPALHAGYPSDVPTGRILYLVIFCYQYFVPMGRILQLVISYYQFYIPTGRMFRFIIFFLLCLPKTFVKQLVGFLSILWFLITGCQQPESAANDEEILSRNPATLVYTKHARCRMNCRHIDESEVQEILKQGRINYRKSEPAARPDPKYALEGTTHDGQHVRIVFAPARRGTVVITVIDLDTEWACHCR
jgi:hypothetical protein